jgi:hypothetical protein
MDCYNTISGIVKALQISLRDSDKESKTFQDILIKLLELMGRYIDPNAYVKMLLPRVLGDVDSATMFSEDGTHSESSCIANAIALYSMIEGILSKILMPHSFSLIPALSYQQYSISSSTEPTSAALSVNLC